MNTRIMTVIAVVGAIALLAGCSTIRQADFAGPFVGAAGTANGR